MTLLLLLPMHSRVTIYDDIETNASDMFYPLPGYGMLCNEENVLCDSEKFDCVGAVVTTANEQATTIYNVVEHTT